MQTTSTFGYLYHDKPVFGIDIGYSSLKVMQINRTGSRRMVSGYGVIGFDSGAITNGVISSPETVARAAHSLFSDHLTGEITTKRVAMTIPASQSFTRPMTVPTLTAKELTEAVRLEAEQYIPLPVDELYLNHTVVRQTDKQTELLAVAAPKKLVDSYVKLSEILGLELVALETTIGSAGRLFEQAEKNDVPTILIDFGSIATDITLYDKALVVTGTIDGGGDSFTQMIAKHLNVSPGEAYIIKTKYGLSVSKKQQEIANALSPLLDQLSKEVRRMIRYYEERSGSQKKVGQIVTMGGGANMPGLTDYLTSHLRVPVRMSDPWRHLEFKGLEPPQAIEKTLYITVAGLALMSPAEAFA